jgi:hypothetical protein
MNDDRDSRDSRRWQIGVAISVVFGLFGVLMAILNYSPRTPAASGEASGASGAKTPAAEDHGKRHKNH